MMMSMHYSAQIILLAVGFGVGYWILIIADSQAGRLKSLGNFLGMLLIAVSIIFAMFSCYYSLKIGNRDYMQSGCPRERMQKQGPVTDIRQGENRENAKEIKNNSDMPLSETENSDDYPEDQDRPIKRRLYDHE